MTDTKFTTRRLKNRMHQMKVRLLVICLGIVQFSCADWDTSYSGKYDEENLIMINLYRMGSLGIGRGGIGRELLEGYLFELKPIKKEYLDQEIRMRNKDADIEKVETVKGKITFNDDYSVTTIAIQTEKDGVFYDFPGNGTHRLNEGD